MDGWEEVEDLDDEGASGREEEEDLHDERASRGGKWSRERTEVESCCGGDGGGVQPADLRCCGVCPA